MNIKIEFTPGLPPPLTGACIFLMWDGMLCEGTLHHEGGRLMLTHYNLAAPNAPEKIVVRADSGKVQGYTPITGHARVAG